MNVILYFRWKPSQRILYRKRQRQHFTSQTIELGDSKLLQLKHQHNRWSPHNLHHSKLSHKRTKMYYKTIYFLAQHQRHIKEFPPASIFPALLPHRNLRILTNRNRNSPAIRHGSRSTHQIDIYHIVRAAIDLAWSIQAGLRHWVPDDFRNPGPRGNYGPCSDGASPG